MSEGTVVVGGGLAAQRFCETLRSRGYEGRLRVISEEAIHPYDRPPLSKQFLSGQLDEQDLGFRHSAWYDVQQVELLLGQRAVGLNAVERLLHLQSGDQLRYEHLLIATGSTPRRLPMAEGLSNVHYLRTVEDARALKSALRPGSRLAIVGAGFIGQEVAATARKLGVEVTMLEAMAAPLERIVGAQLGNWFARLHREQGVELILGATITEFRGSGQVEELLLDDGRRIECDAVLIGVGILSATQWLAGNGLPPDGVPVDEAGQTSIPHVYAAGDAARPFDPHLGAHVRSEHWEAAARQAITAATTMLGLQVKHLDMPSFWSDQYGLRIQYLGHSGGADGIEIEGDPVAHDFAAVFHRRSRPVAALLVGRPRALPEMRRRLAAARSDSLLLQPNASEEEEHDATVTDQRHAGALLGGN